MNVAVTRAADGLPRRSFTVDDIGRMLDAGILTADERIELVEGDLVMMAAKGVAHERIKHFLAEALVPIVRGELMVGIDITLQLSDDVLIEPDICVLPRRVLTDATSRFAKVEHGDVLLAIEIAVSSLGYDKNVKAPIYARHGVHEYWVVDANERVTWVHAGPKSDGWASVAKREASETLTPRAVSVFAFRLADVG